MKTGQIPPSVPPSKRVLNYAKREPRRLPARGLISLVAALIGFALGAAAIGISLVSGIFRGIYPLARICGWSCDAAAIVALVFITIDFRRPRETRDRLIAALHVIISLWLTIGTVLYFLWQ